ncbi:MAG: acyl transferase [Bacteroidia bacterium]|nr:acyl transferase [Bacteroidia bacterium]
MKLKEEILNLLDKDAESNFDDLCHQIFLDQAKNNKVYNQYLKLIGKDTNTISSIHDIPLMPISFFKNYVIKTGHWQTTHVFKSSGTTQNNRSINHVRDINWYNSVTSTIFRNKTNLEDHVILALLPSYIENSNSSLIHMVKNLMGNDNHGDSKFFRFEFESLFEHIHKVLDRTDKKVLLIGVTFALLDFCKNYGINDHRLSVMFTGGMKNRQEELTIPEIVSLLGTSFPCSPIWSEYGMTELASQAYAKEDGIFKPGATLKVIMKEITDPFESCKPMKSGQVGLIDLANIDTVSFILSEDIGREMYDGFNILGRMDNSDIRGCNLLYLS